MKKIYPPIGYKFNDGDGIDSSDEHEVLKLMLYLSGDNEKLASNFRKMTNEERVVVLQANGFEIVEE